MGRIIPLLLLLTSVPLMLSAQSTVVDSLISLTATAHDTVKVQAHVELCRILRPMDTERAVEHGELATALAFRTGDTEGEAMGRQTLANAYIVSGNYPAALRELRLANDLNRDLGNRLREAACFSNMAIIHLNLGNLGKSLEYHMDALRIREETADSVGIANSLNNLGVLYTELGSPHQALIHYEASLRMKERLGLADRLAVNINNIAICHRELGDTLRAKELFLESLGRYRAQVDLSGEAMVLGNLGNLHMQMGMDSMAMDYHRSALQRHREVGNPEGEAIGHLSLSEWFQKRGDGRQAAAHADTALRIATVLGSLKLRRDAHLRMGDARELTGDTSAALSHLRMHRSLNDSLRMEDAARQMAELQARLETERIERELDVLKAENELNLQRIVFEKRVTRATSALLLISLLMVALAVYAYRGKKRDNRLLEEKNAIIGQKNTDIVQSINYAKRIQKAVLSSEAMLRQTFPDSMVLFRPKDIVSGDFFWTAMRDGKRYAAVADCTGHGVPGAFVSIVGHTELTKALRTATDPRPDLLLQQLDLRISEILRSEEDNEVSDGMDIALCALDTETGRLEFSGACRPLTIISMNESLSAHAKVTSANGRHLHLLKGSRRPVGKTHRESDFELLTLQLSQGDRVYLSSDGFADQFGGEKDRKLGNRALQGLLLSTAQLPMDTQLKSMETALSEWMGHTAQTDDICMVGFEVKG